jgi:hypothetical protein
MSGTGTDRRTDKIPIAPFLVILSTVAFAIIGQWRGALSFPGDYDTLFGAFLFSIIFYLPVMLANRESGWWFRITIGLCVFTWLAFQAPIGDSGYWVLAWLLPLMAAFATCFISKAAENGPIRSG